MSLMKTWCGQKSLQGCVAIAAIASVFFLAACGDNSSSSGPSNNGSPEVIAIKNKSISGVSQKGPFVTGSVVKLYELDGGSYAQIGKNFTGKITTDDGKFSVSSVTLASQYALLEANGYFRNEITGDKSKGPITLYALTDLSDRKTVNINLLTHLEYERALFLIRDGKDLSSAKQQAEAEILNAFGIKGEFASSEDLDIFSKGDGNAALLAFSVLLLRDLNEADLTELLTKFATDIESDGNWDDEATKAKIADWAQMKDFAGEFATIRSNIEKWDLGTVPEFEKYVRNFWYTNYGLGECGLNNNAEVLAVDNKLSDKYGTQTRYICKDGMWIEATDFEKDTYKWKAGEDGEMKIGNVTGKKYRYYESLKVWVVQLDGWSWDVPKVVRMNPEIAYDSITDSRDGRTYKTVKIGNQVWMAENLNYADSVKTPSLNGKSWCYDNEPKNCAVAGRLYTWAAAIDSVKLATDKENPQDCGYDRICTLPDTVYGICPQGWHLPTKTEWETLFAEVGGESTAGKILKSQTGWFGEGYGTDAYGFSALPAGYRDVSGEFFYGGYHACFLTASMRARYGVDFVYLIYDSEEADLGLGFYSAFSVRCLKN